MKRSVSLAGALLAVLVFTGAGLSWRHQYVRSPEYTLQEIRDAVAEKNRLRFERYVDVEGLVDAAIDEVFARSTLQTVRESTSGFGVLGTMLGAQAADALKPGVVQELRTTLLGAVEDGKLDGALAKTEKDSAAAGGRKIDLALIASHTGSDQMRFAGLGDIVREEDVATVALQFRNELLDTTLVLRLRMERNGERWKVTRPDNLSEYLADIQLLQEQHLAEANRVMRDRISKMIKVGPLRRTLRSYGFLQDYVYLRAEIENIGGARLDSIILRVLEDGEIVDDDGALIHLGGLDPGETATAEGLLDYNPYIDSHRTLRYRDDLDVEVWLMSANAEGWKEREMMGEYLSWSDYMARKVD